MIDGISGVIIWTGNLNRMVEFYRDILGFPVHSERPHFVAFEWGDMRFSIGTHSEISGPTREPHRVMINLATKDIDKVYETLTEKGVRFIRLPEQEHWGGWVATFYDPDGNILQLLQQPD